MSDESDISVVIRGIPAEAYGDHYNSHILEMWKTYLVMADRISDRRERANAFFVTIHTGVFAGIGFLMEKEMHLWTTTIALFAGIPFAFLWYRLVRSYRDLNSAKFKVVHAVESLLPLKLFDAEWEAVGRGTDPDKYLPFTHIELKIPFVVLVLYCAAVAVSMLMACKVSGA